VLSAKCYVLFQFSTQHSALSTFFDRPSAAEESPWEPGLDATAVRPWSYEWH